MSLRAVFAFLVINLTLTGAAKAQGGPTEFYGPEFQACNPNGTTADLMICLGARIEFWDDMLNSNYQAAMRQLPETRRQELRSAQRAWIARRDQECFEDGSGGTFARVEAAECHRVMTAERAIELGEIREASASSAGAAATASPSHWEVSSRQGPAMVSTWTVATDGRTELRLSCNVLLGQGVLPQITGYEGTSLQRVDDASEPVRFLITRKNGRTRSFDTRMHYVGWDGPPTWPSNTPLPVGFLDEFARGTILTVQNGEGRLVATYDLTGTSRIRPIFQRVCGM